MERRYAIKWLEEHLADAARKASAVREAAEVQGIAHTTLRRAFREMGGTAYRLGRFPVVEWYWSLPGRTVQNQGGEYWTVPDPFVFDASLAYQPNPKPISPDPSKHPTTND